MKYETKHNLDDLREENYTEKDIPAIDREAIDELIKQEKERGNYALSLLRRK